MFRTPGPSFLGVSVPFPHMSSLLLIKLVASGVLKSHDVRQGLSVLTGVQIVNASTSVPMLCNVALALWLPVGAPSVVCVAEQLCVIVRAAPQDAETGWGLSVPLKAGGQLDGSGCYLLAAQPFVCG